MKNLIFAIITMGIIAFIPAQNKKEKKETAIKTEEQKVSYSMGFDLGRSLSMQEIEIDQEMFFKGIADAIADNPHLSEKEMNDVLLSFHEKRLAEKEKKHKEQFDKNVKEGKTFLDANKKKPGVITLPDGLQYKIIKKGDGPVPADTNSVTVHYKGYFIDGTEFDSSYKRNEPATFPVIGVIPGWTEALKLMSVGSKWELYIPYQLAYGENGRPPKIEPAKTLLFEIELLGISDSK